MLINGPAAGAPTGTHAFIVGVSAYPFADGPDATARGAESGIANLTCAARSASEIAAWLLREYHNPDAPLASLRILLSPVDGEQINPYVSERMGGAVAPATRSAVETDFPAFKEDCRSNPDNVAFVYIAGHGWQLTSRGAVVLLHDFAIDGKDYLYGAIDVVECQDRMDEDGNAHHQVWFSDACRETPDALYQYAKLSGAYQPGEKGSGTVDSTALLLSASERAAAWATIGETTIFCQALLAALRGEAGEGPSGKCAEWHVPVTALEPYLQRKTKELLAGRAASRVDIGGRPLEFVLHRFEQPPHVDIEVNLDPFEAQTHAVPTLRLGSQKCPTDGKWPLRYGGDAGLYTLMLRVPAPFVKGPYAINARPPREVCNFEVSG